MNKIFGISTTLVLILGFYFAVVPQVQTSPGDHVTERWAKTNLVNGLRAAGVPIWPITRDGTNKSVRWSNHAPNRRFAIYDLGANNNPDNPATLSDDLVLDKETGLVWPRDANIEQKQSWLDAIVFCRGFTLADRMGWRLPTVEELSSLLDPSQKDLALPSGHPFINVQRDATYWTSTTSEGHFGSGSTAAWHVFIEIGQTGLTTKNSISPHPVWPVRGGNGYATGDW